MGARWVAGSCVADAAAVLCRVSHNHRASRGCADNVKAAFMRWNSQVRKRGSVEVNRRNFWAVFTDYEVIADGAFLCLPIDHFELFDVNKCVGAHGRRTVACRALTSRASTHRRANSIFVHEVFFILALFCKGPLEEKLSFAFELFDFSGKGHLTLVRLWRKPHRRSRPPCSDCSCALQTDFVLLLQSVTSASHKFNLIAAMPSTADLEAHARELFTTADGNMDDKVELAEFIRWSKCVCICHSRGTAALTRVRRPLIERQNIASQAVLKRYGSVSSTAREKAMTAKRAMVRHRSRPYRPTAVTSPHGTLPVGRHKKWASESGDGDKAAGAAAADGSQGGVKGGAGGAATSASYEFSEARRLKEKTRAMKLRTMANRKVLGELVSNGRFNRSELLKMAKEFNAKSGVDMYVSLDAFREMLKPHVPHLISDSKLLERVYACMDLDEDGRINFKEFALGVSRTMRGTLAEKVKFLFELLDVDSSGDVDIAELVCIIKRGNAELRDVVDFSAEVMKACDLDGNGEIDREEFTEAMRNDLELLDAFCSCISITVELARAMHSLKETNPSFDFARVDATMSKFVERRAELQSLTDYEGFKAFMFANFDCTAAHEEELRALFKEADADGSGEVMLRDILNGFAQVLTATQEEQVAFLFTLYDLDGSGTLDRNEIMHMLLSAVSRVDGHATALIDLLATLDADGDGKVTLEEFSGRASRSPHIMGTLRLLFAVPITSDLGPGKSFEKKPLKVARSRSTTAVGTKRAPRPGRRASSGAPGTAAAGTHIVYHTSKSRPGSAAAAAKGRRRSGSATASTTGGAGNGP